jgi:penicillin V acylase-like amidase (Ntn superfamily)
VKAAPDDKHKPLAITAWVQYVLDNYASVAEAVEDLRKEPFYVATMMTPDGHPGQLHLSISDETGDSAIFEYLGGKLVIHHGRQYQVMTNAPAYDQQVALNAYWETVGGRAMLPGTSRPADRFVRTSFYVKAVKQTADPTEAVATAFSLTTGTAATSTNRRAAPTCSGSTWPPSIFLPRCRRESSSSPTARCTPATPRPNSRMPSRSSSCLRR